MLLSESAPTLRVAEATATSQSASGLIAATPLVNAALMKSVGIFSRPNVAYQSIPL
jgi:hypothetical protein